MLTDAEKMGYLKECRSAARQTLEVIIDLIVDSRGDIPSEIDDASNAAQDVLELIADAEKTLAPSRNVVGSTDGGEG